MNYVDEHIDRMYREAMAHQEKIVAMIESLKKEKRKWKSPKHQGEHRTQKGQMEHLKQDLLDSIAWTKMLNGKRFKQNSIK